MPLQRTAPRAVGPVRARGVELRADARQDLAPVADAPRLPGRQPLLEAPRLPRQHVLVAAAPEHDARVAAEPRHLVPRLALHERRHRLILRVRGAGEHEVLPHQHAHFVAAFVEALVLVDAAAPDAQHVEVGAGRQLDEAVDRRRIARLAREERRRDPVRARHRHLHAVHLERKPRAMFVGIHVQFAGAHPQATHHALLGVAARHRRTVRIRQLHVQRVQRLATDAARPPAIGALHLDHHHGRAVGAERPELHHLRRTLLALLAVIGFRVRLARRHAQLAPRLQACRRRGGARPLHAYMHLDARTLPVARRHQRPHLRQARAAPALEPHLAGQARCGNARPPVPAEVARALADEGVRRPVAIHRPRTEAHLLREHVRHGRADRHLHLVHPGAHGAAHVKAMRHELAGRIAHVHAVHRDPRDGVNALEHQLHALLSKSVLAHLELRAPRPVRVAHPFLPSLAVALVHRRNHARADQVQVHAPGHLRSEARAHRPSRHRRMRTRGALDGPGIGIGLHAKHRGADATAPCRRRRHRPGSCAGRGAGAGSRGCRPR